MKIRGLLLALVSIFTPYLVGVELPFEKVTYHFSKEPLDVVIPSTEKDIPILEACIASVYRHIKGVSRVIVVSKKHLTNHAEWFDETLYPFSKEQIALEVFGGDHEKASLFLTSPKSRIGWIYQQFLKFYAPFVIPGISSNVLIVDSDIVFLRNISFTNDQGGALFTCASEHHLPYFEHMQRLIPWMHRVYPNISGVAHHMLFQRPILEDLFYEISSRHGVEPWKAICRCIDEKEAYGSSFSEYEIYSNFAVLRTNQVSFRNLKWENKGSLEKLSQYKKLGYVYMASHSWERT